MKGLEPVSCCVEQTKGYIRPRRVGCYCVAVVHNGYGLGRSTALQIKGLKQSNKSAFIKKVRTQQLQKGKLRVRLLIVFSIIVKVINMVRIFKCQHEKQFKEKIQECNWDFRVLISLSSFYHKVLYIYQRGTVGRVIIFRV